MSRTSVNLRLPGHRRQWFFAPTRRSFGKLSDFGFHFVRSSIALADTKDLALPPATFSPLRSSSRGFIRLSFESLTVRDRADELTSSSPFENLRQVLRKWLPAGGEAVHRSETTYA